MSERLPAAMEAGAIMRGVEAKGGFATIIRRGDPDRGALTLLVASRGELKAVLERRMATDFSYKWAEVGHSSSDKTQEWQRVLDSQDKFDPDSWLIELDIPDAERFVAETVAEG